MRNSITESISNDPVSFLKLEEYKSGIITEYFIVFLMALQYTDYQDK